MPQEVAFFFKDGQYKGRKVFLFHLGGLKWNLSDAMLKSATSETHWGRKTFDFSY